MLGSQSGRQAVNDGLKDNFKEINKLKDRNIKDGVANPYISAYQEYIEMLKDSDSSRLGDLTLMRRYGPEIEAALEQATTEEEAKALLNRKYPWMQI